MRVALAVVFIAMAAPSWADTYDLRCTSAKIGTFRVHLDYSQYSGWVDIPGRGKVALEDAGSVGTGIPGHVWSGGSEWVGLRGAIDKPQAMPEVTFVIGGEPDRLYVRDKKFNAKCSEE